MELADVASSPHFKEDAAIAEPGRVPSGQQPGTTDPQRLAALTEDPAVPLAERLAAGSLLGLLGDPRLGPTPATVHVPAATVEVGLPAEEVAPVTAAWAHVGVEESWIAKEIPVHTVRLAEYFLATYPVTNGEYARFLRESGHQARPTTWYLGAYPWDRANHPVAGVQPEDAEAYAAWLTAETGHPWRLPTEAEWEYAAKGPDGLEFPWGAEFDPDAANTRESGVHTTSPVGAFPAGRSPFGAHDMAGNVEEYVLDTYVPYPGGPFVEDHLVQAIGEYRVARGGSFSRFGDLTRTRRRHGAFPGPLYPVGFRLATSERPV
ncbi:SUMF1/EgtB/PvdO family nonheme iron enzyme [Kitasatospora sp. GP82]|uniref:formylglycine-generating enzyme family protein n=1 Tax=Kitasatospora sp. GP82 TaxID=3035089 RepID=UPI00247606F6|nr:SUMF1/EgtB/PvdO family nonheme iron enzyme [Kitasatospora sp. GP82]MDH6129699.1 formylglycine-generating enzyme required for sulfatase activity [Kitasatospora sp. GP82]